MAKKSATSTCRSPPSCPRARRLLRQISDLIALPFATESGGAATYRQLVEDSFVARVTIYRIKFFLTFFGNFLDAIGPLVVLTVGGWLVMRGGVDVGALVAFISGFQKLADPGTSSPTSTACCPTRA